MTITSDVFAYLEANSAPVTAAEIAKAMKLPLHAVKKAVQPLLWKNRIVIVRMAKRGPKNVLAALYATGRRPEVNMRTCAAYRHLAVMQEAAREAGRIRP